MLIDINPEFIDEIIRKELKSQIETFKSDLKKERPLIFTGDAVKDKRLIRKHIRAFKLILEYYGE